MIHLIEMPAVSCETVLVMTNELLQNDRYG